MKCSEFETLLHTFFIGEATPDEKRAILDHAEACSKCAGLKKIAHELQCKDFVEFLSEYIDDALPTDRKAVFERHLAICPECTAYLASYRKTIDMTKASGKPEPAVVEDMPEDLARAIVKSLKRK